MQNSELKLSNKFKEMLPHLNERQKRIYLTSEAAILGRGGVSLVSRLSNVSRPTIIKGKKDLKLSPFAIPRSRKKMGEENPYRKSTLK